MAAELEQLPLWDDREPLPYWTPVPKAASSGNDLGALILCIFCVALFYWLMSPGRPEDQGMFSDKYHDAYMQAYGDLVLVCAEGGGEDGRFCEARAHSVMESYDGYVRVCTANGGTYASCMSEAADPVAEALADR